MTAPVWFSSITWSSPVTIESLRTNRNLLPHCSGVYVFTNYSATLEQNFGVLYVGKATSLNNRVKSYLVDPSNMLVMSSRSATPRLNSSLRHAGKVQLLVELQQRSRGVGLTGIWVRWTQSNSPAMLEQMLIGYLHPAFNTQGLD
jgi:hypothetical protein